MKILVVGQFLWEGIGKTQVMIVKGINAEGVTVEFTWSGDVKGVNRAKGVNGSIVFTGTKIAPFSGGGRGTTTGQGILFTPTDMVAIKSSGYGNPKWEKDKSVELWSFIAASEALKWLNDTIAVVTEEGDPAWKDFKVRVNEWLSS